MGPGEGDAEGSPGSGAGPGRARRKELLSPRERGSWWEEGGAGSGAL